MWIAVGTSGSDLSLDDGRSWKPFDQPKPPGQSGYNALGFSGSTGWAVGSSGAIACFRAR
jgi:hypothetical protein